MQRRNFLKTAAILSTAGIISPVMAATSKTKAVEHYSADGRRHFTLTQDYQLIAPEAQRAWSSCGSRWWKTPSFSSYAS